MERNGKEHKKGGKHCGEKGDDASWNTQNHVLRGRESKAIKNTSNGRASSDPQRKGVEWNQARKVGRENNRGRVRKSITTEST